MKHIKPYKKLKTFCEGLNNIFKCALNTIQQVFFNVKRLFQHNEIIPNSWDSNFMGIQTQFQNMDKNSLNIINDHFSK
jgi:hypothetical protein